MRSPGGEAPRCRGVRPSRPNRARASRRADRKIDFVGPAAADLPIDPLRLGDRLEPVVETAHRLGAAEQQNAALAEREMEQQKNLFLRLGAQIDQQIAAGDQVEARERRIGQHILHREHHHTAQLGHDPVAVLLPGKEASEPRRRYICRDRLRITSLAGESDRILVDIGGEDLQLDIPLRRSDLFEKQHGEGIGLLASAAAGNPDPQRPVRRVPADEIGNHLFRQQLEGSRVAEKAGDVDQQILDEEIDFACILPQHVEIPAAVVDSGQRHAPFDPAHQRARLVEREIVRCLRAQQIDNLGQLVRRTIVRHRTLQLPVDDQPPAVCGEDFGNLRHREHEVHGAGHDRAARHAVILGIVWILHDNQPALLLDRLQPQAAVAAGSRQDHADRAFAELFGQRVQEEVERQARAVTLARLREAQNTAVDREVGARRDQIDMLGLDRHPVRCLLNLQRRVAGEQIDHHAGMRRIEMLDQDEGHAGAGGEHGEKSAAGIEAAGRGAQPDDRVAVSRTLRGASR